MTDDDEEDEAGVFKTSTSDDPRYSAVFEDDGEVAYGYMMIDKNIVSDVWLYNTADTPTTSPWRDGADELPFRTNRPSEPRALRASQVR